MRTLQLRSILPAVACYEPPLIDRRDVTLWLKQRDEKVQLRVGTSDFFVFQQVFLKSQYDLTNQRTPYYILDAGANIGLTSLYFLQTFPSCRIIAVEPHPENLEIAAVNVAAYSERCHLVHGAVWIHDEQVAVERGSFRDGRHWACTTSEIQDTSTLYVPASRIETLMKRFGFPRIDLLKVDIEGAETLLFGDSQATFLEKTNQVMIECHGSRAEDVVCTALAANGFSWKIRGEILHATRPIEVC